MHASLSLSPSNSSCNNHFLTYTVPVVEVDKPDIDIPENETEVEVCFVLSTGVTDQVVVTAETGPKTGAADQATGLLHYKSSQASAIGAKC